MNSFVLAQVVGVINFVPLFLYIQQKNKARLLALAIVVNLLFALQFLLLGAYTGMLMSLIGVARCLVFYFYEAKGLRPSLIALATILILTIGGGLWTWQNALSILPILASGLSTYAMWQNKMKVLRFTALAAIICFIIYDLLVGAYSGFLVELFDLGSTLLAIWRHDIRGNQKSKGKKGDRGIPPEKVVVID